MSQGIGARAVRGAAWLGSGQLVRQVLAFVTNIALARLLFPDDFGLFGMTVAASEIAQILTDFGLGAAIIQRRESDACTLTTCFWLNLAIAIGAGLLLFAAGPMVARYFGREEIRELLLPLSFNMVLGGSLVVPLALLTQRMQFREITVAQTSGSIAASLGTVGLAAGGIGVWALAMQPLIGSVVTGVCLFRFARWRPAGRPRLAAVNHMLSFSGQLLGNSLLGTVSRNLHAAILGRFLGSTALGVYNLASGITGSILYQVSSVVVRVLFPTLANLRDEPERLREAWLKACAGIAMFGFPAMAGVVAVAPDLIPVVFGPQWTPGVGVLRILSANMAIQSVLTTSSTVLMVMGRADLLLKTSLASTALIGMGLWLGAQHGIEGAAEGYALASLATYALTTSLACRECGLRLNELLRALLPYAAAALGMAIIVVGLGQALAATAGPMRLVLCIGCGIASYALLILAVANSHALGLIREIRVRMR